MRNIKLVLEYDGASFSGFQKQPGKPTIQAALEKALTSFFARKMKIGAASGRTDAGVHAEGQVVNFKTASAHELWQIQKGLNALLPSAIVAKEIEEVPADFHARYSAKSKVYEYRIWNHACRSPLLAARSAHVFYPLNVAKMKKAAKSLLGRHDFRSFTSPSAIEKKFKSRDASSSFSYVRTIKHFSIKRKGSLLWMRVEADGFLYHMIRNIAGTLIEVGRGRRCVDSIPAILKAKDRRFSGMTAPAEGLTLISVTY